MSCLTDKQSADSATQGVGAWPAGGGQEGNCELGAMDKPFHYACWRLKINKSQYGSVGMLDKQQKDVSVGCI